MIRKQALRAAACAAFLAAFAFAGIDAWAQARGDSVRPEVGKPLQEAQNLMKAGRHRDALAKVNEADAASGKTAHESLLVNRMRGSIAVASGDNDTAIRSFESVLATGKVSGREEQQMVQAVAVAYYKKQDYAKAAQWTQRYFKEGGADPAMRTVLLQSYYLGNDCNAVNRLVGPATENGGRRATEEELQILANCYLRQKDTAGYVAAIEKLVVLYPKKQYWTDLLARMQKKPGFSDRLSLHVYRLRLATNNFTGADDYMELAQLALQAGVPPEAKLVVDKGYAAGVLGTGRDAERHGRLRALVDRSLAESQKNRAAEEQDALAAKDGNALVTLGLNYVFEGKGDKGIGLIEQGIKKGGLKRPEDAKLALGYAQIHTGNKGRAVQTLKNVAGADGTADIARLWVLHARV